MDKSPPLNYLDDMCFELSDKAKYECKRIFEYMDKEGIKQLILKSWKIKALDNQQYKSKEKTF